MQNIILCKVRFKGIATPSSSGNASVAAWNDSIDLYCVKHTERQWQWHLKQLGSSKDPISPGPIFEVAPLHIVVGFF